MMDYPGVAENCRLIKDITESVIITTDGTRQQRSDIWRCITQLKNQSGNVRQLVRELQPYVVSLIWYIAKDNRHQIQPLLPDLGIWRGGYDDVRGITLS
jgi:ABC-type transporter Mla subunit MlaD